MPTHPTYDGEAPSQGVEIEVTDTPSAERSRTCANGPGHTWCWNTLYEQFVCDSCSATGMPIEEPALPETHVVAQWRKGDLSRTLTWDPAYGYCSQTLGNGVVGSWTLGTWDQFRMRWWTDDLALQEVERLNGTGWERVGAVGGEAPH